ncbi:MAG TPA: hypothetical protein VGA62_06045 [Acidimicrobiia bacterium]
MTPTRSGSGSGSDSARSDGRAGRTGRPWLWTISGLVVVLAIALVVVLLTRDDGSDHASPAASTTPATTTTSPPSTTTTTTTTPPPSTTVALPQITEDPQTYAEYLLAAWRNGDRTAAANVASADAVNQMFAQAAPAKGPYSLSNCGPAAGSLYCTWNGQNGATLQMTVRTLTGGLPVQVEMVQFTG